MAPFVSCDWGSSSFRLSLADLDDLEPRAVRRSDRGCSDMVDPHAADTTREARFATYLQTELARLGPEAASPAVPVVLSGMVTSAHGWVHLPYAHAPVCLQGDGLRIRRKQMSDGRPLWFVSGVRTDDDVMRGEECQLAGLLTWAQADGHMAEGRLRVIMPGTHCKHVRIQQGQLIDFRTFMTGEMFQLLRSHSVLAHSVRAPHDPPVDVDRDALAAGVRYVMLHGLAAALFNVRVGTLLRNASPTVSVSFLNGVLIGAEFDPRALDDAGELVLLCATGRLQPVYEAVLDVLGFGERTCTVPATVVDRLALMGHARVLGMKRSAPNMT